MGESFQGLICGLGALVSRAVQPSARRARLSLSTLLLDSKGSPMLEAIVGITIFAVVGAAVLGGVSTTRRTGASIERQGVAETIARNQIENLFSQPYRPPGTSYATSTSSVVLPPGFNVTLTTQVPRKPAVELSRSSRADPSAGRWTLALRDRAALPQPSR
jgi:type II secretory pathway pseudopilin PulG